MTAYVVPESEIESHYPEKLFRVEVSCLLHRRVSRTRLYEWRRELGILDEPLTYDYARAVAYYGKLRGNRNISVEDAIQRTKQFCIDHDL